MENMVLDAWNDLTYFEESYLHYGYLSYTMVNVG